MLHSPANRLARFLFAIGLTSFLSTALVTMAVAQHRNDDMAAIHDRCVALAESNPTADLEKAKLWRQEGGGFAADHCIAMALFGLKDYSGAAKRFESLATAMMQMPAAQRALTLNQAGQSWLAANEPAHAKADFDAAVALNGADPDLLIDRAEAFAALRQYWEAIDDLNSAIDLSPKRADAYIYRGSAYRSVDALDLALEDVERGLALAPTSVLGLLERGNIRKIKGDVAGARRDWWRVTELAPNTPAAAAAQVNLDRLGGSGDAKAPKKKKE
jgi:tetratricopeptide (TPR) repeat protein